MSKLVKRIISKLLKYKEIHYFECLPNFSSFITSNNTLGLVHTLLYCCFRVFLIMKIYEIFAQKQISKRDEYSTNLLINTFFSKM